MMSSGDCVCSGGAARLDDASARSERRTDSREDEEESISGCRWQPDAGGEEEKNPEKPEETGVTGNPHTP